MLESRRCCTGDQWLVVCYYSEWCHEQGSTASSHSICWHFWPMLLYLDWQSVRVFGPKATNLLLCIDAVPWPFYDASTSSVRHCIIVFHSSSAIAHFLVNFGFSSSTVAVLCGHLFRIELRLWGSRHMSGSILLGPVCQAAAPVRVECCSTSCTTSCSTGLFSSILVRCALGPSQRTFGRKKTMERLNK